MDTLKNYRHIAIITFIIFLILSFFLFASIWNGILDAQEVKNKGTIILLIVLILLMGIGSMLLLYHLSDSKRFNDSVNKLVEKERIKIMTELQKTEDNAEEKVAEQINIDEWMNEVVPKIQARTTVNIFAKNLLSNLSKKVEIIEGLCYIRKDGTDIFENVADYAFTGEEQPKGFKIGETLPGEVAKSKEIMNISDIPEDYFQAESGLGKSKPRYLLILPILFKNKTIGIIELAAFKKFNQQNVNTFSELGKKAGEKLNKLVKS
jgi:transcriptional regulator with GAF, ATPase, and Fis domain